MTRQLLGDERNDELDQRDDDEMSAIDISPLEIDDDEIDDDEIDDDEIDDDEIDIDISHLETEDDTPVDNFQSELQQRLLVEPLYSAQALPAPFLATANVGLFYKRIGDPIVPDVMLSLGVQRAEDFSEKRNRAYFVWEFGKVPEVCIEIVSNRKGDELKVSPNSRRQGKTNSKKDIYAQIKIPYYVIFDPFQHLKKPDQMNGALLRVWSLATNYYTELTPPEGIRTPGQLVWLEAAGLGLTLWQGEFEEPVSRLWLRWCDRNGIVIPTGAEGQAIERQRTESERQRTESERQRAESERERAESERQRADRLAEQLRAMGINPDDV